MCIVLFNCICLITSFTLLLSLQEETTSMCCIGPDCTRGATPPSLYCSDHCIEKHAAKMLRIMAKRGMAVQTSPGEFVRGGGGVSVVERATGKVFMGLTAPSEKKLVGWLKNHPTYQVFLPHGKGNDIVVSLMFCLCVCCHVRRIQLSTFAVWGLWSSKICTCV